MMDTVRTFSEYIQAQVRERLPEKYQEAGCWIKKLLRNNGVYGTAMEFHVPGENAVCSIYMNPYYAEYEQRKLIGEILEEIVIQIRDTYEIGKLMKENHIEDFRCMKPYLRVSIVNTGRKRQRLLGMPHMEMEDLSIICRVEIPSPEGYGSVEVTNDMLKGCCHLRILWMLLKYQKAWADKPASENVTETPASEQQPIVNERTYIFNTNTKKYHNPTCRDIEKMKDENKQEYAGSREDIMNQGYDPCKHCNP